jgi:hypothetical protein
LSARTWTAKDGYSTAGSCNADVYVFAVLTATDHASYGALVRFPRDRGGISYKG